MTKLLKYCRGYVRIRVSGLAVERFLNLCGNRGIMLWEIDVCGDGYCMNIHLESFWELRPIVKKTRVKVAVLERYGLPFFLPKMWKRGGFLVGLVLALFFWISSTFFVWEIELDGNTRITEDVFGDFLEKQGISVGILKSSLDIQELEKEIRREFPDITWTSAKIDGTKLEISVKENDAPILVEKERQEQGMDLVAENAGTIVSMIVRKGVPKVKVGDVVEEGSVLVEGKVPIFNEDTTIRGYHYVDSDADILVERVRYFSTRLPFDYMEKQYTGRQDKDYYFRWETENLKFLEDCPYLVHDSIIVEKQPMLFELLKIPLFFGSVTHREYVNTEHEYTLEQAQNLLNEKIIAFLTSLEEKGVQIIEKNVKIDTNSNSWVVEAEILVREPLGVAVETEKFKTGESIINE